jgi:hypothetical protein
MREEFEECHFLIKIQVGYVDLQYFHKKSELVFNLEGNKCNHEYLEGNEKLVQNF